MKQKQLRIYFKDNTLSTFNWCYLIDGVQQQAGDELSDLFKPCVQSANDSIFIVAQFWVYETSIAINDKNAKQLLTAPAYQLEDQLAEDVDDLHFAQGNASDNKVPFIAIKHELMQSLIAFEKNNGLTASAIVNEMSLCSPPDAGEINMLEHLQHILFKSSDNAQNAVCHHRQIDFFRQHFKSQHPNLSINQIAQTDLLCSDVNFANCINLKQKMYSQGHAWQSMAKQLALPIVLMVLVVALLMFNQWQENQQLKNKIVSVKQQQTKILNQHLKQFSPSNNIKSTLIKALQKQQSSGQQSGFIFYFHEFIKVKKHIPSVRLIKVDYRKKQLIIDIKANNLQQLDQLMVLMKKDFKVTLSQMDSSNNTSQARIVLEHK